MHFYRKKKMFRKIHRFSGLLISVFIGMHLINHLSAVFGPGDHIDLMNKLRPFYRNLFAESFLVVAIAIQLVSGFKAFRVNRKMATSFFEKIQVWTGLYLAVFLVFHLSAVFGGRIILGLDTNFYFGVAGLNTFPFNLFFIPYYALAIISFFGHLSAIHNNKMRYSVAGIKPNGQARFIFMIGVVVTLVIFYGLTNGFAGVVIPIEYNILIGK